MNSGFLIKGVKIHNFRGYDKQEFTFFSQKENMNGLILLGGPNGYGKTSLLDAIEWCMTGTIQRIVEDYEIRKERNKKMQKCLLRHNGSLNQVNVLMQVNYQNNPLEIERIFTGDNESDGFSPENTTFKVNGEIIKEHQTIDYILKQSISKEFYERYTSSYEKNIRVYEKSRNDIYDMFSAFFGGTKEVETIINNLDGYTIGKNKIKGLIDELNNQILEEYKPEYNLAKKMFDDSTNSLKKLIDERKNYGEVSKDVKNYPKEKIYNQEILPQDILGDNSGYLEKIERIKQQVNILNKIKFIKEKTKAYNESESYISELLNRKRLQDFENQVVVPYEQLKEVLKNIQGKNVVDVQNEKSIYEGFNRELIKFKDHSKAGVEKLIEMSSSILDDNDQEIIAFKKIDDNYSKLEKISNQLEGFKSSDPAINALRSLVDHSVGFHKLRDDGTEECPLCGSKELFSKKGNRLLKNAIEILGDVDSKRSSLQKSFNEQKEQISFIYIRFSQHLLNTVNLKIKFLNNLLFNFESTKILKNACLSFNLNFNELNEEILQLKKNELKQLIKEEIEILVLETSILDCLENDQCELDSIPNPFNGDLIKRNEFFHLDTSDKIKCLKVFTDLYEKKSEEIPSEIEFDNIQIEIIIKKLTILDEVQLRLVNDKVIKEMQSNVDKNNKIFDKKEKIFNKKIIKLKALKEISQELKKKRKQWDRQMVDEIRLPLQQIYRRINRHTNIEGIKLIMDGTTKTKASLMANIENEEVSATNILSAGQLSVVALSIFLTVAMGQKNNVFKCYFMDDPIQTMDDLNILSFIDLLRSELSNNRVDDRFVDQLFFTTCDENLENLMIHKMKNFGVNYSHIHFTGYGMYEVRS